MPCESDDQSAVDRSTTISTHSTSTIGVPTTMLPTFSTGSTSDNSVAFHDAQSTPLELFTPSSQSYIETNGIIPTANQQFPGYEKGESSTTPYFPILPYIKATQNQQSTSQINSDDDDDRLAHSSSTAFTNKERSRSFRSHTSHATSHDTHHSSTGRSGSPFDVQPPSSGTSSSVGVPPLSANSSLGKQNDGLARSSSNASTTPTSPETELNASSYMVKEGYGSQLKESTSDTINIVQPQRSPAREAFVMESRERIVVEHSVSLDSIMPSEEIAEEQGDAKELMSPTTTVRDTTSERSEGHSVHSNKSQSKEDAVKSEEARSDDHSIPVLRTEGIPSRSSHDTIQSSGPSIASLAHRNKPLPVPKGEVASVDEASSSKNQSSVTIPALSISTTDEAHIKGLEGPPSLNGSTSNLHTIEEDSFTQRSSFKSFLNKSGKLFRTSTYSRDSQLSPWTPEHSPDARLSDTSLPSRNASPNSSSLHVAVSTPGSRNNSQSNLPLPDPNERSASPFGRFGKGILNRQSRNREKSAGSSNRISNSSGNASNQNTPLPSPSISSNSDSSPGLHNEKPVFQQSHRRSHRLSHHFSSFSVSSLAPTSSVNLNTATALKSDFGVMPKAGTSAKQVSESDTVTAAIAEASRKLQLPRPKLLRTRSKSFDDLASKVHPEAIKSLAVGTVSIMEDEPTKMKQAEIKSKDIPERPWSRLAGSLRRKPTASTSAQVSVGTTADSSTKNPNINEVPPKLPPKDTLEISTDAWWESKPIAKKEFSESSPAMSYMQFEAAQLAEALSRGDEDVISRMANAVESPKTRLMPLESPEKETKDKRSSGEAEPNLSAGPTQAEDKSLHRDTTITLIEPDVPQGPPRSKSSLATHRRSISLGKVFEPLVSRSRSRSNTVSRDVSESTVYESAQSASSSFHGMDTIPKAISNPSNIKRSSTISPPSSYRADRLPAMTSSESDSSLHKNVESSHSASKHRRSLSGSSSSKAHSKQPVSLASLPPRSSSISSIHQPRRGSSSSTSQPIEVGEVPLRSRGHNRKPSLNVDTDLASSIAANDLPKRPSSAMGMSANLERGSHVRTVINARQPTLSIADDHEFLQALEQVRKLNQARIQKQREEKDEQQQRQRKQSLSKQSDGHAQYKWNDSFASGLPEPSPIGLRSLSPIRQRSSSAGAHLEDAVSPTTSSEHSQSPTSPIKSFSPARGTKPSPLELGVGKASGKMRDGAFINDEDWKKEVKALFVIREIVLTERSYASHLEALLATIRQMDTAVVPPRRMQTSSLMMTSAMVNSKQNQNSPVPQHLVIMRNLLPQLITLSRTLANRIDENPTAAGVGAAFRLVGNQMEATFVAWNSAVKDIMDALRISEGPKGKARNRIGLVTILSPQHLIHAHNAQNEKEEDEKSDFSGFKSVPSSPTRGKSVLEKMFEMNKAQDPMTTSANTPAFVESPTQVTFSEDVHNEFRAMEEQSAAATSGIASKRRSTISSMTPSMAAALRKKISSSALNAQAAAAATVTTNEYAYNPLPSASHLEQAPLSKTQILLSKSSSPASSATASPMNAKRRLSSSLANRSKSKTLASSVSSLEGGNDGMPITPSAWTGFNSRNTSAAPTPPVHSNGGNSRSGGTTNGNLKKLTAMDIVIMPTQRIPRYLLLLRDLHANTPPQSLSNARLQRSLDFVHRVAVDCDRVSKGGITHSTNINKRS